MSCCGGDKERPADTHTKVVRHKVAHTLESGVKVVLVGDTSTGKTSIVNRITNNTFQEVVEPTVGAFFETKKLNIDGRVVLFEVWDTAGQERFRSLAPMYYRDCVAAILVYDITRKESFTMMQSWLADLKKQAQPAVVMVAANKCDLEEQRTVTPSDLQLWLEQQEDKPLARECSAKTGCNVAELFDEVGRHLLKLYDAGKLQLQK
eukprot:TRINITY_DN5566_c0_g1_i1.p1 TRINITY_DN5566_c0_g1~~TRINITY_DN5566_c0_g1_i1.p1  ORF type:complete len:206 (+),score=66.99 TRINITY_DN5566_c0_g1_i1:54-671(+)